MRPVLLFLLLAPARAQLADDGAEIKGAPAPRYGKTLRPGELPDEDEDSPARRSGKTLKPGELPDDEPAAQTPKPPKTLARAQALFGKAGQVPTNKELVAGGPWIRVGRVTAKSPAKGAVNTRRGLDPDKYRGTIAFRDADPSAPQPTSLVAALAGVGTERPARLELDGASWEISMEKEGRVLRCARLGKTAWLLCAGSEAGQPPAEYVTYAPRADVPDYRPAP
jgi:hypothetical protein